MEYKMILANYELSAAGAISGLSTPNKQSSLNVSSRNYEKNEHKLVLKLPPKGPTSTTGPKDLDKVKADPSDPNLTRTNPSQIGSYFSPIASNPKSSSTTKSPYLGSGNINHKSSTPIRPNDKQPVSKTSSSVSNSSRTGQIINKGLKFFSKDSG